MPTLLHEAPVLSPPQAPPRKRWTREQLAEFEASGLFRDERIELVGGELISEMGKNRAHANALHAMFVWLAGVFGINYVNSEAAIDVHPADNPTSEPQPDLIVLSRETYSIRQGNPQPHDLRLVVEVSDSSLQFDLGLKAALYAHAGIAEYWVLDVAHRRVVVHRQPEGRRYLSIMAYGEAEHIAPLAAPESQFNWSSIIPPL